jgi:hypothetical protein
MPASANLIDDEGQAKIWAQNVAAVGKPSRALDCDFEKLVKCGETVSAFSPAADSLA